MKLNEVFLVRLEKKRPHGNRSVVDGVGTIPSWGVGRASRESRLSLSRQGQGGGGGGGTKAGASIVRFNYIWITESDN